MSAEITTVTITNGDITSLIITNDISNVQVISDVTSVNLQSNDTTVLTAAPATLNLASLSFAIEVPQEITRNGSVGVSALAARADHVHSGASLMLDGGNY